MVPEFEITSVDVTVGVPEDGMETGMLVELYSTQEVVVKEYIFEYTVEAQLLDTPTRQ